MRYARVISVHQIGLIGGLIVDMTDVRRWCRALNEDGIQSQLD